MVLGVPLIWPPFNTAFWRPGHDVKLYPTRRGPYTYHHSIDYGSKSNGDLISPQWSRIIWYGVSVLFHGHIITGRYITKVGISMIWYLVVVVVYYYLLVPLAWRIFDYQSVHIIRLVWPHIGICVSMTNDRHGVAAVFIY